MAAGSSVTVAPRPGAGAVGRRTPPPGRFLPWTRAGGWQRGGAAEPRYGDDPCRGRRGRPHGHRPSWAGGAPASPFVEELGRLSDDQWAQASWCEGWSAWDAIRHPTAHNTFWTFSCPAGRAASPPASSPPFDPVAPAELVAAAGRSRPRRSSALPASTEAFAQLVESFTDDEGTLVAESPPGRRASDGAGPPRAWDSCTHERRRVLPLGGPGGGADEVVAAFALRRRIALAWPNWAWTPPARCAMCHRPGPRLRGGPGTDGRVTVPLCATPADPIDLTLTGGAVDRSRR